MSILGIIGCVVGVVVLAFGGLFLYGACRNSAQEYAPDAPEKDPKDMTEEEYAKFRKEELAAYKISQMVHS